MKLSVCMITYNHEKYIRQAPDSILMQKVNFEHEIVIGEDCSTDKTRCFVMKYQKKYPKQIRSLLHKENQGMIPNFIQTVELCRSKYIAMFKGDNYRQPHANCKSKWIFWKIILFVVWCTVIIIN